jgi:hypothetical protein
MNVEFPKSKLNESPRGSFGKSTKQTNLLTA